jgi:hypothetical protein
MTLVSWDQSYLNNEVRFAPSIGSIGSQVRISIFWVSILRYHWFASTPHRRQTWFLNPDLYFYRCCWQLRRQIVRTCMAINPIVFCQWIIRKCSWMMLQTTPNYELRSLSAYNSWWKLATKITLKRRMNFAEAIIIFRRQSHIVHGNAVLTSSL